MIKAKFLAAALAVPAAILATAANASQTVDISLTEPDAGGMSIAESPATVHAGPTTFTVANASDGMAHEFLIAPLKGDVADVPMTSETGRVNEDKLTDVKELGDLEPGKSGSMTVDLKPGKYLLFCNLPGHYMAGMHTVLTVTD